MKSRILMVGKVRSPDFVIGGDQHPYLRRWWLIPRNPIFNIYLHEFCRSDDDRALHDHPWFNVSIILEGSYTEHTIRRGGINRRILYCAGNVKFRSPWAAHRIELNGKSCWSLFITGPRLREWGFHCPLGWRHWREFTSPQNHGEIGRGCE